MIEEVLANKRSWHVEHIDVLEGLRALPEGCVHTVVTSPPYWGLRTYGVEGQIGLEATPDEFIARMVEVFREVHRVLHPTGTCWINLGDSYSGGGGYSPTSPSNLNGSKQSTNHGSKAGMRAKISLPPKSLMMMPARVALALQDAGWLLRSEITWCLSGGTRLYARTQKGDMPSTLKDLVRLDPSTVQLWNGERWTQVTAWTGVPRPEKSLEIELRNGERIGCTMEHLWPTQRGTIRADELKVGDVIPLCRLPEGNPPISPELLPDADIGWLVGYYLAEGDRDTKTIRFSAHAKEIGYFNRIAQIADSYHGKSTFSLRPGNGATIRVWSKVIQGILDTYVSGEGSHRKHLTSAAWQRSDTFLEGILKGYLAGDGCYNVPSRRWKLGFTNNDALAADLRTLSARLGYSCRLKRVLHQMGDRRFPGWRGSIRVEQSTHCNTRSDGEVMAIQTSRARQFWDVSVADEPHLFSLASGILTHNCKKAPMPESCTDRPTSATEKIYLFGRSPRYYYDQEAVREGRSPTTNGDRRIFRGNGSYANNNSFENGHALQNEVRGNKSTQESPNSRNMWNYWLLSPEPFAAAHFATFPTEIPRRAIRAGTSERGVCPECGAPWRRVVERKFVGSYHDHKNDGIQYGLRQNGKGPAPDWTPPKTLGWEATCTHSHDEPIPALVLDPFSGAGTTGLVARRLGRRYIGLELNAEYVRMSEDRIAGDAPLLEHLEEQARAEAEAEQLSMEWGA